MNRRASESRFGRNCQMLSLPLRVLSTMPASSKTRRCLVIAWRLSVVPSVSRTIGRGPSCDRREMTFKRVSSPRAAKRGAGVRAGRLRGMDGEILLDEFSLMLPAAIIGSEGLGAPRGGDFVEPTLGDDEACAFGHGAEFECHEGLFFG